jgi:hypothetical protein
MRRQSNLLAKVLLIGTLIAGCEMANGKSSNDLTGFRDLVETDVPATSVRWEVFGTPEYSGGVPGPTDYVTLIAELEPSDQEKFRSRPETGEVWIAPEAARPWLAKEFRSLLQKHANSTTDLSTMPDCRVLRAKIKKSGKPVSGFICNGAGRSLMYLTLVDETAA